MDSVFLTSTFSYNYLLMVKLVMGYWSVHHLVLVPKNVHFRLRHWYSACMIFLIKSQVFPLLYVKSLSSKKATSVHLRASTNGKCFWRSSSLKELWTWIERKVQLKRESLAHSSKVGYRCRTNLLPFVAIVYTVSDLTCRFWYMGVFFFYGSQS
jgi:hypothetical protein